MTENTSVSKSKSQCAYNVSVEAQVLNLLEKDGYSSLATESTVSRITEMLMNDTLQTEEQLSALLGIKEPSLTIDNNKDDDEGHYDDFCIEVDVDGSQDDCVTLQTSDSEVKDKCHEVIEKYSTLHNSLGDDCQINEDVAIFSDPRLHQRCVVAIEEFKICPTAHTQNGPNGCLEHSETNESTMTVTDTSTLHECTSLNEKSRKYLMCDKTLLPNSDLKKGNRASTGEKIHNCPTCEKTFCKRSNLLRHIRKHIGKKPYKCSNCEKAFTEKFELRHHLRVHTGEKPYMCLTCKKVYSSSSGFRSHIKRHCGQKTHKCPICKVTFSWRSNLHRHIKTHTGERPNKCPTCGKDFTRRSHLRRHIRTHTGEKPHKCSTCGRAFSQRYSLTIHMITHSEKKIP